MPLHFNTIPLPQSNFIALPQIPVLYAHNTPSPHSTVSSFPSRECTLELLIDQKWYLVSLEDAEEFHRRIRYKVRWMSSHV